MKSKIYTFYWTVKAEVKEPIHILPTDDLDKAMAASKVISVQKEMTIQLIKNMTERQLVEKEDGYELIEYAYSEGNELQTKAFEDFISAASADHSFRYIFVSPMFWIGRWHKMKEPPSLFEKYQASHPHLFQKPPENSEGLHSAAYNLSVSDTLDKESYTEKLEKAYRLSRSNMKRSQKMKRHHAQQRKKQNESTAKAIGFTQEARKLGSMQTAELYANYADELSEKIYQIAQRWTLSRAITWNDIAKRLNADRFEQPNKSFVEWKESSLRSRASRNTIPKIKKLKALGNRNEND